MVSFNKNYFNFFGSVRIKPEIKEQLNFLAEETKVKISSIIQSLELEQRQFYSPGIGDAMAGRHQAFTQKTEEFNKLNHAILCVAINILMEPNADKGKMTLNLLLDILSQDPESEAIKNLISSLQDINPDMARLFSETKDPSDLRKAVIKEARALLIAQSGKYSSERTESVISAIGLSLKGDFEETMAFLNSTNPGGVPFLHLKLLDSIESQVTTKEERSQFLNKLIDVYSFHPDMLSEERVGQLVVCLQQFASLVSIDELIPIIDRICTDCPKLIGPLAQNFETTEQKKALAYLCLKGFKEVLQIGLEDTSMESLLVRHIFSDVPNAEQVVKELIAEIKSQPITYFSVLVAIRLIEYGKFSAFEQLPRGSLFTGNHFDRFKLKLEEKLATEDRQNCLNAMMVDPNLRKFVVDFYGEVHSQEVQLALASVSPKLSQEEVREFLCTEVMSEPFCARALSFRSLRGLVIAKYLDTHGTMIERLLAPSLAQMGDEELRELLPVLPPDIIYRFISQISEDEQRHLLSQITPADAMDHNPQLTVRQILEGYNRDYLPSVQDGSAPEGVRDQIDWFLEYCPLPALVAASLYPDTREMMVNLAKIMSEKQLRLVVPAFPPKVLFGVFSSEINPRNNIILKCATTLQKMFYLKNIVFQIEGACGIWQKNKESLSSQLDGLDAMDSLQREEVRRRIQQTCLSVPMGCQMVCRKLRELKTSLKGDGSLDILIEEKIDPVLETYRTIAIEASDMLGRLLKGMSPPDEFVCPISGMLMRDPVRIIEDKEREVFNVCDRSSLRESLLSPFTRNSLGANDIQEDRELSVKISAWREEHPEYIEDNS